MDVGQIQMATEPPLARAEPGSHAGGISGKRLKNKSIPQVEEEETKSERNSSESTDVREEGIKVVAPGTGAGIPHGEPAEQILPPETLHLVGRRPTGAG